jgi:hypothetical protein
MGRRMNMYRVLVGTQEGKIQLGRSRLRRVDSIKIDLVETGWDGVTGLVWLRIGTSGDLF